jgi:hypothetical protein
MLSSKVDSLGSSRASTSRVEAKPRTVNMVGLAQDLITTLNEKFEKLSTDLIQSQTTILNRMISLERDIGQQNLYQQRYQQNQLQPRGNTSWNRNKAPQEQRIPNTLALAMLSLSL